MQLEELQAIWETQTKRPLFSINEFGLHLALYQIRERARRRRFWGSYFPGFVSSLVGLVALLVLFLIFFLNDSDGGFSMDVWDVLALLVAAVSLVYCTWSMVVSRRKHEQEQSTFAPSLRQEIERGIAQIDFEISTGTTVKAWRFAALICLSATLMSWEVGRLNGDRLPWDILWTTGALVIATCVVLVSASRRAMKQGLHRKRVLEGLLADIDESPEGQWNFADEPRSCE